MWAGSISRAKHRLPSRWVPRIIGASTKIRGARDCGRMTECDQAADVVCQILLIGTLLLAWTEMTHGDGGSP